MSKTNKKRTDFITEESIKPENVKVRISIILPLNLIQQYKAEAKERGVPYQTLMQLKLSSTHGEFDLADRVAALEVLIRGRRHGGHSGKKRA